MASSYDQPAALDLAHRYASTALCASRRTDELHQASSIFNGRLRPLSVRTLLLSPYTMPLPTRSSIHSLSGAKADQSLPEQNHGREEMPFRRHAIKCHTLTKLWCSQTAARRSSTSVVRDRSSRMLYIEICNNRASGCRSLKINLQRKSLLRAK